MVALNTLYKVYKRAVFNFKCFIMEKERKISKSNRKFAIRLIGIYMMVMTITLVCIISMRHGREPTIPKILHRTSADFKHLKYPKDEFHQECKSIYSSDGWKVLEWEDDDIEMFVKSTFPMYYKPFMEMEPPIRRIDAVRYLWMYEHGGLYLDMDVECIRSVDKLIDAFPKGSTAWIMGFPEPFVMMSTKGNFFWLYAFERILRDWRKYNVRSTGGPQGLDRIAKNYVRSHGIDAVRLFSISDKSVADSIYPPGDVVVGEETWRWIHPPTDFAKKNLRVDHKVGFFPGNLFDPTACLAKLGECKWGHCHDRPEEYIKKSYAIHHCMFSWSNQASG